MIAQAAELRADRKRIPSTLMNPMQRDRAFLRDVLQWDVHSWKTALDFWAEVLGDRRGLTCLEIGAGSGGVSLWLALNGHHVTCSDRTQVARAAAELHRKYGVAGAITYADVDATAIDLEECFDVIVFKSVLGGIGRADRMDRQELAVREMHKALKPGGQLLFAENGAASPLHQLMRKRFVPWGAEWRYPTRNEMRQLLAPFRQVDLHATGFVAAFGRSERQRDLLALFDRWVLNRVVPHSLSYIFYGAAVK